MIKSYKALSKAELEQEFEALKKQYEEYKAKGLKLDMSRGKPAPDQLDLTEGMLSVMATSKDCFCENGVDCRNYGGLDGIPEAKAMFADILGVEEKNVIVGGNSSLNMMFDTVSRAMISGILYSEKPWCKYDKVKFLCPVPGYDRHFAICEHFGIEMINIPMTKTGPDMDLVEKYVSEDETVKGIWCVPMYSNPQGITYSDETVKRFAALKPKAKDFRIFWDNAYCIHHLNDTPDTLLNIFEECKKCGSEDMVYEFASTSKISFPGSGVAVIAASDKNIENIKKTLAFQTIGPDKLNQLRHVKFFKNADGLRNQALRHKEIIAPKFDIVLKILDKELTGLDIASWNSANGGYFLALDTLNGCAKRTLQLLSEAGVVMTPAGSTYPYKNDPNDTNIRIAPTYPSVSELEIGVIMFCLCIKLAALEKLLK